MDTDRRTMILALGAAAAAGHATAAGLACAQQPSSQPASPSSKRAQGHQHSHIDRQDKARTAVAQCITSGEACLAHCLELLGAGDTSLAECSKAVHDMLAICRAFGALASSGSPFLSKIVALCKEGCERCEKACDEHADKHEECGDCRDACGETIRVLKTMA